MRMQYEVGDIVIERATGHREIGPPIHHFTWVEVSQAWPDEGLYMGRVLRKTCYVDGYPELGRSLPHPSEHVCVFAQDLELAIHL